MGPVRWATEVAKREEEGRKGAGLSDCGQGPFRRPSSDIADDPPLAHTSSKMTRPSRRPGPPDRGEVRRPTPARMLSSSQAGPPRTPPHDTPRAKG